MDASQVVFTDQFEFGEFIRFIKHKDLGTFEHSFRVYELAHEWIEYLHSRKLCLELNAEDFSTAALLHDLGKIGVLGSILSKEGPLTEVEREMMASHAEIGYELLRDRRVSEAVLQGVRHHHERWDGRGYPLQLKGSRIPLCARLIAIIDAFDAMTSDRPYQRRKSPSDAAQELRVNAGSQFDPVLVQAFLQFLHARNS